MPKKIGDFVSLRTDDRVWEVLAIEMCGPLKVYTLRDKNVDLRLTEREMVLNGAS